MTPKTNEELYELLCLVDRNAASLEGEVKESFNYVIETLFRLHSELLTRIEKLESAK